ncbi:MAG TPA: GDP-mannose 4,6-dehydratase [Bacteroidia bacterium]|nr:GDP-mannose 4,6-dehydratase [Bacteroidia bacterium]
MNHKILITGAAGFIGSHVAGHFLGKGFSVCGIDNFDDFYPRAIKERNLKSILSHPDFSFTESDITDKATLAKLPADIVSVIHLAAKAGVRPSIQNPEAYIKNNITGTWNILEWMKQRKISKMIFASSSSVYGNNPKTPFSESDSVDHPISPYAFTKKSCELMNYTYHHLCNMDILNLRFFTVYGERQRPDLAIYKFIDAALEDKPVTLFGDGSTARDYTYVKDIVSGVASAFDYVQSGKNIYDIINLGNNKPVKLMELVDMIYEITGKKKNIIHLEKQPGDVEYTCADISKAKKLLDYNPSTSMKDGLVKFAEWYKGIK